MCLGPKGIQLGSGHFAGFGVQVKLCPAWWLDECEKQRLWSNMSRRDELKACISCRLLNHFSFFPRPLLITVWAGPKMWLVSDIFNLPYTTYIAIQYKYSAVESKSSIMNSRGKAQIFSGVSVHRSSFWHICFTGIAFAVISTQAAKV